MNINVMRIINDATEEIAEYEKESFNAYNCFLLLNNEIRGMDLNLDRLEKQYFLLEKNIQEIKNSIESHIAFLFNLQFYMETEDLTKYIKYICELNSLFSDTVSRIENNHY